MRLSEVHTGAVAHRIRHWPLKRWWEAMRPTLQAKAVRNFCELNAEKQRKLSETERV